MEACKIVQMISVFNFPDHFAGAPSVGRPGEVMAGPEFRERVVRADGSLNRENFDALWPAMRVMGRCSPQDKYTIVRGTSLTSGCRVFFR